MEENIECKCCKYYKASGVYCSHEFWKDCVERDRGVVIRHNYFESMFENNKKHCWSCIHEKIGEDMICVDCKNGDKYK